MGHKFLSIDKRKMLNVQEKSCGYVGGKQKIDILMLKM